MCIFSVDINDISLDDAIICEYDSKNYYSYQTIGLT